MPLLSAFLRHVVMATAFMQIVCPTQSLKVDVRPHPEDLRSKREAMEMDVATPLRLTDGQNQVASTGHFRSRRSSPVQNNGDDFSAPVYKLKAFGDDIVLRLTLDDDLLAPAYTTTLSPESAIQNKTEYSDRLFLRGCFYKGKIVGHQNSHVGVSLCDSMTGSFATDQHQYFIEPLKGSSTNGGSAPHSIRRRSVGSKRSTSGESSLCGVNEARHRTTYRRTFRRSLPGRSTSKVGGTTSRQKRSVDLKDAPMTSSELAEPSLQISELSRSKRSFDSRQHYIETMVVADASMLRHHGDDLEHYILSIMMVANRVFSHPSLGSAIALSVVKIMILDGEGEGPRVSTNAAHSLRNFCSWQRKFNVPSDEDPSHYDLAILLTKKNLCGDTCETLGMAEVGAMCSSRRSCAIVEDDGLSASYTIAHEVGHVLNMMHDDNRLCRANFAFDPSSHVMSSTMERVDSAQPWSLCSKQAVIDFLEDGRGGCLLDKPQKPKVYPQGLPGAMYDVNAQCEMSFGEGAIECPYMRECSRLWCQLPNGARPNQCHTKNFPRADGSPCAPGSHCMQGRCVVKETEKTPIHGRWGSWSQYGSCSRSCGGGIQMSSRQCNNPAPEHGGRYCIGSRLQFRSCHTQPCRPDHNGQETARDFRNEQCASYNGQRFPILGVKVASTWIPKYLDIHPKDRCKLICQSEQTGSYVTLSQRVIDGTRCGPDTTHICVHGQCMPAGCDGTLGSKAKYNKCGLCNVSNKQCRRIKGKYNRRQSGYNDVVTFPKGATSIRVVQKGFRNLIHDGNYLALVDADKKYLLNGNITLTNVKTDVSVNGTVFQYTGVGVSVEKIHSTKPLREPFTLQVLSLSLSGKKIFPPKIRYSYYVVKPKSAKRKIKKNPKVKRKRKGRTSLDSKRRHGPFQRSHPSTNSQTASTSSARWVIGRWTKCKPYKNRLCGAGWKKRKVSCKIGKKMARTCVASQKPYHRLPCFVASCPTVTPIRNRPVTRLRPNSGPSIIHQITQHNEKPIWVTGMWGSCSVSCGKGIKKRIVMCQTKSARLLDNSICDPRSQPRETHKCTLRECP